MSDCAHKWEPIQGWFGRYRCEWCHALAYRTMVAPKGGTKSLDAKTARMRIYLCKRKGCTEPAVSHRHSQLCSKHLGEAQAQGKTV